MSKLRHQSHDEGLPNEIETNIGIEENKNNDSCGLVFHTFSDFISLSLINFDVMTFYVSFVLLIGNMIRGFISGNIEKIIITEMPEPQKILNLCEGIKISRYRHDFLR